jgi:hypothetical protein
MNESDDDDEYLVALNMEACGSRGWFLYLGYMIVFEMWRELPPQNFGVVSF